MKHRNTAGIWRRLVGKPQEATHYAHGSSSNINTTPRVPNSHDARPCAQIMCVCSVVTLHVELLENDSASEICRPDVGSRACGLKRFGFVEVVGFVILIKWVCLIGFFMCISPLYDIYIGIVVG